MNADRIDYEQMLAEFELTEDMIRRLAQIPIDLIDFPHVVKVAIGPSRIHGQGLIATQPIDAGDVIAPAHIGDQLTPAGRYTNHAKHANAQYCIDANGDVWQVALADIPAGEEITNDYRRNARVAYASVNDVPLTRVSRAMVSDAMRAAHRFVTSFSDAEALP